MKEKEDVYQVPYTSVLGVRQQAPSPEVQQKEEERILRNTNSGFIWAALGTIAAGALLAVNAFFPLRDWVGTELPIAASAAAFAAAGLGLYHLYRHVFVRKRISFPSLTIKRKTGVQINDQPQSAYVDSSSYNRVFFGVAGGIANATGIPATLIRIFFVGTAFFIVGIPLYILLAIVMPPSKRGDRTLIGEQKRLPR